MSDSRQWIELDLLLDRVLDAIASEDDVRQLNEILRTDAAACRRYISYIELHGRLLWGEANRRPVFAEHLGRLPAELLQPIAAPIEPQSPDSGPVSPLIVPTLPVSVAPFSAFVGSGLFSYLVAALIVGLGLVAAAAWKLSDRPQIATQGSPSVAPLSPPAPRLSVVARVTGMVDCIWDKEGLGIRDWGSEAAGSGEWRVESGHRRVASGQKPSNRQSLSTIHYPLSTVSLGDVLALKSGLLELTYDTGARVILQGPVTYKVDSVAGGYLSVGKLTAKLEKRSVGRGTGDREAISRPSSSGHQPLATNHYPLSTAPNPSPVPRPSSPAPTFAVRTPTALITDLGTEFGVEVSEDGTVVSHVFRGVIEVRPIDLAGRDFSAVQLHADESTRVERHPAEGDRAPLVVLRDAPISKTFKRSLPSSKGPLPMQVLAHFRLGEDDPDAAAGQPVGEKTVDHTRTRQLQTRGSLVYTADTAMPGSSLAMDFNSLPGQGLSGPRLLSSPADNFILEAWVRPNRVPSRLVPLVYNGQSAINGYGLAMKCGRWAFLLGNVNWGGLGVSCEPQQWTHLALVAERGHFQLWVNGRPDGASRPLQVNWPDGPLTIGSADDFGTLPFDGQIDEVRLAKFRGPFRTDMLSYTDAKNPTAAAGKPTEESVDSPTCVMLSTPNNVAPLATPIASSCPDVAVMQVGNAIDACVHCTNREIEGSADQDATSFLFGRVDDSLTLDLRWEQPQHLTSLQAYVAAGGVKDGVADFDRNVASVTFFVDHGRGAGWEPVGTAATVNTNDIGVFDLTKIDGDWPNVKQVRYQFTKTAGAMNNPRVAEVLAIAAPLPEVSTRNPATRERKEGLRSRRP